MQGRSWIDPAAMSLIKAKRLKTIEHDGKETATTSLQGHERWSLFTNASVTAKVRPWLRGAHRQHMLRGLAAGSRVPALNATNANIRRLPGMSAVMGHVRKAHSEELAARAELFRVFPDASPDKWLSRCHRSASSYVHEGGGPG